MTERERVEPLLRRYYEATYGEYPIGEQLTSPSGSGEVLWSYRHEGNGPLIYAVDDHSG